VYANKGEEKRLVMPDKIKPFKKKCLYELKGFLVFDESEKQKLKSELTAYMRSGKNSWIKIFNTRKELEYKTECKLKENTSVLDEKHYKKACGGYEVNFEDQFLHKYLYKGLIYKLIAR
jgi:hypothetical protein